MAGDIVIQGVSDFSIHLDRLSALTQGGNFAAIPGYFAFRFRNSQPSLHLDEFCLTHQLDWAWVPAARKLADFKLVVFDMDSTLIANECIDELAQLAGVAEAIIPLTERAMRGEIDFASSFRQRIALLRGMPVTAMAEIYEQRLQYSPGALTLLKGLRAAGLKTMLITSGFEYFAERLKTSLGLDQAIYNQVGIQRGRLTGEIEGALIDADGKAKALDEARAASGLHRNQVIAIGDGANDLAMLARAGVSIAYHGKPLVRERATHALNFVGLDGVLNLFDHPADL